MGLTTVLHGQRCSVQYYSKASRYTASSCTDLDHARFWIGSKKIWDTRFFDKLTWDARIFLFCPKNFWDARFLINCSLRCTNFLFHPMSCTYTMKSRLFWRSITIIMHQYIFSKQSLWKIYITQLSCEKVHAKKENKKVFQKINEIIVPSRGQEATSLSFKKGCIKVKVGVSL